LIVHSSSSIDAPRSLRIVVSAVETTSVSSATISEAIEVRARTQVFSDCGCVFTGLLPVVVDGSMAFLDCRPGEGPKLIGGCAGNHVRSHSLPRVASELLRRSGGRVDDPPTTRDGPDNPVSRTDRLIYLIQSSGGALCVLLAITFTFVVALVAIPSPRAGTG